MLRSYRSPGVVVRERLPHAGERNVIGLVMVACLLLLVAQGPRLAREAHLDPSIPFDARFAGALFAMLFVLPLAFYAVNGLLWVALRVVRGAASGLALRFSMAWSLFSVAPLWLGYGLVRGFLGRTVLVDVIGLAALAAFAYIFAGALRAALRSRVVRR